MGALLGLLLLLRVPSLVQPSGADQSLYAYVGDRILEGGLPYRDAWDQKPPAIHFTYAVIRAVWPHDSVVAAVDLLVAAAVAAALFRLGGTFCGSQGAGATAAALFLLLGDPSFNRLAGVRVRSQCETFIALAVSTALLLAVTHVARPRSVPGPSSEARVAGVRDWYGPLLIGILLGIAFIFKYNAVVYLGPATFVLLTGRASVRWATRRLALIGLGALIPSLGLLAVFAAGGALNDLYDATIRYNLDYSGETYGGPGSFFAYLLTFPMRHARVDALWLVGGLGCLVLLLAWAADRRRAALLLPVVWVAAACLSIAINGSRGLPQYFVQAAPALALAAGVAAALLWRVTLGGPRLCAPARAAGLLLVAFGAWRVTDFDKLPRNAAHDLAYMTGRLTREAYLARYGDTDGKYAALAVSRLGAYLAARTRPSDPVYIFGFSPGAYLAAGRVSASRFFWSRPILVAFNDGVPGYGVPGLLADLERRPPKYVVLQVDDWAPAPGDSATFFTQHDVLGPWLRAGYRPVDHFDEYEIWHRTSAGTP